MSTTTPNGTTQHGTALLTTGTSTPSAAHRLTRRSALVLGAGALGATIVAGRAGGASAATAVAGPVELGPATLLQRDPQVAPVPTPPAPVAPPAPAPPPVQVPGYAPTFAKWSYSGNTAVAGSDRWTWQTLQGDRARPTGVRPLFVYATAVQRPSDPAGITQCMRPADVRDEWFLRNAAGRKIHRGINGEGGDYALDVGHPGFRAASAAFLVAKCRTEGWTGIYHDELNGEFGWGAWDSAAAAYPSSAAFRLAQLDYVKYLGGQLRSAGFTLSLNVGEAIYRAWCDDLARTGATICAEFFVAGNRGPDGYATRENSLWTARVEWLEWSVASCPSVVVHEMQLDAAPVRFGLCTFLLVDNGRGCYGASLEYSASTPWLEVYTQAQRLGAPLGPRTEVSVGLWRRDFERGHVLVNSSTAATSYQGASVAPTSGAIILR